MRSPRTSVAARTLAVAAGLALVGAACLHPRGTVERPAITSFDIHGTHAVSAGELENHLVTQASGTWIWQKTRYYDEDAFATDKRRILRYYQARGYYDAKISSAEVLPDGRGRVRIRVVVSEGDPVRVATLDIDGIEGAPQALAKLRHLPLKTGDVFTEAAFDATRVAIRNALTTTGWAKAEVTQQAEVDPVRREARVRYTVKAGERYRFGNVFVAGAVAVPRARVREEAERAVKPGETYDSAKLPTAQANVLDLGVFGGVRVADGTPDVRRGTVPVVVSVREAPFRTVRVGPGFTIQPTRFELDAVAGWTHRNWLGGLRRLNLDARLGYAWLPNWWTSVEKQGFVGLLAADFTQPSIATRVVDLNLHADLERGLEPAYDYFAQRFSVGTPIRLGRVASIIPSLNLELFELTGTVSAADPRTGQVLLLSTCPGHNPELCLLSYLEQRFVLDLRDDPILTTRGIYLGISLQEGFSAFGIGSPYLRFLPELRAFLPLPARMVLAGRARVGIAHPLAGIDDVPIVAKFTSGGPNFMRGYYTRQLSPMVLYTPPNGSPQYIPVGGNGLVDGTVELRFPISGNLGGTVFLDFGNVTNTVQDALNLANLQYAAGAGIRYMTIFGPIRLDVAARLPKPFPGGGQPGVEVLSLTEPLLPQGKGIGVHHEPIVSVHFSIGEAF